jgi:hypothetical protein
MTLTDAEFIHAFEERTLPPESFRHRDHLRLAWLYLEGREPAEAERLMAEGIRRYAAHLGAASKYHHTITLFWMRAVAAERSRCREGRFEAFLGACPGLLDKELIRRHYSAERLGSADARAGFIEPDLIPLDAHATIGA